MDTQNTQNKPIEVKNSIAGPLFEAAADYDKLLKQADLLGRTVTELRKENAALKKKIDDIQSALGEPIEK